jgi:hypothetical protein
MAQRFATCGVAVLEGGGSSGVIRGMGLGARWFATGCVAAVTIPVGRSAIPQLGVVSKCDDLLRGASQR